MTSPIHPQAHLNLADLTLLSNNVVEQLGHALFLRGSSLATADAIDGALEQETRAILREVLERLEEGKDESPISIEYHDRQALTNHGERAALLSIDPAEPLMAAELLFRIALPLMVEAVIDTVTAVRELDVAVALHHAIWRRFPVGAIAYVDALRAKAQSVEQDARHRLARHLHDHIAHGIASGIQRLEVARLAPNDPADPSLVRAIEILRSTLRDVQETAFDLRSLVGGKSLGDAIAAHVLAESSSDIPVRILESGTRRPLSQVAEEEIFMISLEAIRNARSHAVAATTITVAVNWSESGIELAVTDDGNGYENEGVRPSALGLRGIGERARLIGGDITFLHDPGETGIRFRMPFPS